jgi:hypothetical protein
MNKDLETFICEDCKKELPISNRCHSDFDICNECLENYPNKTGWCSIQCRITGDCDQSC